MTITDRLTAAMDRPEDVSRLALVRLSRDALAEIEELCRQLGNGCDVSDGGPHIMVKEHGTNYRFCGACGETLRARVTRYVHAHIMADEIGE